MRKSFSVTIITFIFILFGFSNNEIETDVEKIRVKLLEDEVAAIFLDLSNGEATLIQFSNGDSILVNTGGEGTEKELKNYLNIYCVDQLSKIILTKDNRDYTANLDWLINEYKNSTVVVGAHFADAFPAPKDRTEIWEKGMIHSFSKKNFVEVINENRNDKGSLGLDLMFHFNEHQVLFMTSSDHGLERQMISNKNLPRTNILKVADFGSIEATTDRFVEHVDPQFAIIFHKKDTIPSPDVLERLSNTWIDIYYTRQFGCVTIKFSETAFEVITIPLESSG